MEAEQITARTGGSRIAATLGLLCQYMKDQGGLVPSSADGGSSVPEKERTTMELFPQQAGSLKDPQERRGTERAQLTIFYGGRAMVFDDFPAEKAKELMQLASSDAGAGAYQDAPGQPCWPVSVSIQRADRPQYMRRVVCAFLQITCPSRGRRRSRGSWRRGRAGSRPQTHTRWRIRRRRPGRRRRRASL